jgi:23S rRNA pseudouridine2605 synthase
MPRKTRSPEPRRPSASAPGGERLQKWIASAGVASRRAAEQLIREGRVSVNGQVVRELGRRIDPRRDRVSVDGRRIASRARPRHYLVHKPRGVVSSARDERERRTVVDLVDSDERLFPVGRLDVQSEGLILLTNDGALAQALLHPSFEVPRIYRVSVDGAVSPTTIAKLAAGVVLDDGERTRPCEVRLLGLEAERSKLEICLAEGRRRQIRRMLEAVGHRVRRLVRVQFGPLRLGSLRPGEWRPLRPNERSALARLVERAAPE